MSEARLWARMREGVAPFAFAQRIENAVGAGMPDVMLHSRAGGVCCLVELKYRVALPARKSTAVFSGGFGLRPEQVAWIWARAAVGARVFVLGQCAEVVYLVHGRYARDLAGMTEADLILVADWMGMARRTDWAGMGERLFDL